MVDSKISALTAVTTPAGTDEIPINQGGTNKKLTLSQLNAYIEPLTSVATSASAAGFAADTYVAGSGIVVPQGRIQAGSVYRCRLVVTKTAASTAIPAYTIRLGTNGTTADTAACSFTQTSAQTAAIDTAYIEFLATFRAVGASSGALYGMVTVAHDLAATGFASRASYVQGVASATTLNTSAANTRIGISMNGGTSSAWTVQECIAEILNVT